MKKIKTIFMGTPDFSVPTLDLLNNHPLIELICIVTMPDRPKGRGNKLTSPAVAEYAKKHKLPLLQTEKINRDFKKIENIQDCDLIIVLAFAQFLSEKILELPRAGCFNIHTSILPKYRGAAPIQYALLNGDKSTGVSIQKMVKEMDAGDIVHFNKITINDYDTGGLLYSKLKYQAANSCDEFVAKIIYEKIELTKQDSTQVSYAPALSKDAGYLQFTKSNVTDVINKIRALQPWPGTYCYLNQKRLKIISAEKSKTNLLPGVVSISNNQLEIGCLDASIRLEQIQLEGKTPCYDYELINGIKGDITLS